MHQKETVAISQDNLKVKYYDKLGGNRQLEENTLYIPEASNEKTLDAFFKHDNCLYILQFTIAETHLIKGGLDSLKENYDCPPSDNWKFVFIIDGSQILKVPVPSGKFGATLYSAIMRDESNLSMVRQNLSRQNRWTDADRIATRLGLEAKGWPTRELIWLLDDDVHLVLVLMP